MTCWQHPDKTSIGRIGRGFDFLGYHFSSAGLSVAKQTVANFIEKASRLYEQERWTPSGASPLEMYARRWFSWVKGGLRREAYIYGVDAFGSSRGRTKWRLSGPPPAPPRLANLAKVG
jgi:hypothetical protein